MVECYNGQCVRDSLCPSPPTGLSGCWSAGSTGDPNAMQTFLPYDDFEASAACLDIKRLGKQRVEAMQILRTLDGQSAGWRHHPAVLMWTGYQQALAAYGLAICRHWQSLGNRCSAGDWFAAYLDNCPDWNDDCWPRWLGEPSFHSSHRSNLLRKDPNWYSRFHWSESPDLPYIWPEGRS